MQVVQACNHRILMHFASLCTQEVMRRAQISARGEHGSQRTAVTCGLVPDDESR